jgi:hypothetical protein
MQQAYGISLHFATQLPTNLCHASHSLSTMLYCTIIKQRLEITLAWYSIGPHECWRITGVFGSLQTLFHHKSMAAHRTSLLNIRTVYMSLYKLVYLLTYLITYLQAMMET